LVGQVHGEKKKRNNKNILTNKNRERMAALFKIAADKIGKISMFSDFNEN
jgi:hypothetical protein